MKIDEKVETKHYGPGIIKTIHDDGSISVETQQVMMGRNCVYRCSKDEIIHPGKGIAY